MQNEHLIKYKNPVILKDEEGKGKPTVYDLPQGNHTYGKKSVDDPEPIKYVVNGWKQANESSDPPVTQKNFAALNKEAVQSNVYTAKQQKDFRATRDVKVQPKKGAKVIPIFLPEEEFTYGVPNRPSTPVKLVMGNCFGLEAEQKNATLYLGETQKLASTSGSKMQAKKTKSQALREQKIQNQKEYRAKPNLEQKFKLSKYTQSNAPKINTNLNKTNPNASQAPKQTQQNT